MKRTILGVSFSTRMLGLAVLESGNLIDYSVKLFKETWTPAKMDRILTSLASAVDDYNITDMVLSIPPIHHQEEPFNQLWQEVVLFGKKRSIKIKMYKQRELQALCGQEEMMTRRALMKSLVILFPELEVYYKQELRNKNKYYYKMFEAVGAVVLHIRDVDR